MQGQDVLARRPQVRASARLPQGTTADLRLQGCQQPGREAGPLPPPRWMRRGLVYGNLSGGPLLENPSSATDRTLGKVSQRALGERPRVRRIRTGKKLHLRMEGRLGRWGSCRPQAQRPGGCPGLNTDWACELENAARTGWPATATCGRKLSKQLQVVKSEGEPRARESRAQRGGQDPPSRTWRRPE